MFLRTVDLATFFWTILALDFYGPHTDFCPDLSWMPAYLHIKCGKLTTGHPWNLQRIVHGSRPFVWMTSSTFGSSLLWHPLRPLQSPLLALSQQLLNVVFASIKLSSVKLFLCLIVLLDAAFHKSELLCMHSFTQNIHPVLSLIIVYIFISF